MAEDFQSKDPKNGIMMRFTVSRLDAGKRTVLATPQIVALPGEEAVIEIGKPKAETVKVKVIATRVQ
jgi:type II secretory pathway component GspD/PulD (secretin)